MLRTLEQNKELHKLFNLLKIDADIKETMVANTTNHRTTSTKELTYIEAATLIKSMRREYERNIEKKAISRQLDTQANTLRRNVFRLMYDLGKITNEMTTVDKLQVINTWLQTKTKFDKDFNLLSIEELGTVINQLNAVKRIYKESNNKTNLN